MKTVTITLRLANDTILVVDQAVSLGFRDRAELLTLILTEAMCRGRSNLFRRLLRPRGELGQSQVVAVRVRESLKVLMAEVAQAEHLSIGEWGRVAVCEWLKEYQAERARACKDYYSRQRFEASFSEDYRQWVAEQFSVNKKARLEARRKQEVFTSGQQG